MKTNYTLLAFLFLITPLLSLGQQKGGQQKATPQTSTSDCFKEWYTIFRERGGKPVPDGTHNVVLTLRNTSDGTSKCFMGKVEVAEGRMKPPVMVEKEDGSFDTFRAMTGLQMDPAFEKSTLDLMSINDGMSINFKMSDMEYGRIFFYDFLNDKPKGRKNAPSPKALIKN